MTVVGTAWVELQAMGNKFASSLSSQVNPGLTSVGDTAEHQAGRGRKAFGLMFSTLSTNSNGALAPLTEVAEKIGSINETLGEGHKSAAAWATGIGAAATGAGVLLTTLGDRDKIAMGQLKAAVEATGKTWEDYSGQLEDSAKSGTHYGYSTAQTAAALNKLVVATNDPNEAMKQLNVTMEIAATRHVSLESAARMVGRVYGGSTMILRQFGITTQQMEKPVMDLGKAQEAAHKSAEALQKAQFNLGKVQGEIASGKLTGVKATWALQQAEQKLGDAQGKAKSSADALALAHKGAAGQAQVAEHNLGLLDQRLHGQADAAANTFTGHMRAMGATIENTAASVGQRLGPVLTTAGPILMGVGATAETAAGLMKHFSAESKAARDMMKTLEEAKAAQAAASDAMTASQVALNEAETLGVAANAELAGAVEGTAVAEDTAAASGAAMDIALGPILLVVAAVAALGIGVYEAYEHFKPFRDIVNEVGHLIGTVFMGGVHAVETAFGWLVGVIENHGHQILGFLTTWGPVALAVLVPFIGIPLLIFQHWHQIIGFFEGLWHDVVHIFNSLKADVEHAWSSLWSGAEHIVTGGIHAVEGFFTGMWHTVTGTIGHLASSIWSGFTNAMSRGAGAVAHGLSSVASSIGHWAASVPGILLHAGENLIHGFITGIENKAGDIIGAIKSAITDHVPGFVKKALGIGSPAKAMIPLGEYTAMGYAVGMESGKKHVKKSAKSMVSAAHKAAAEAAKAEAAARKRDAARENLGLVLTGGIEQGFVGTSSTINSTFNKIVSAINKAVTAGVVSQRIASSVENSMNRTKNHLVSLSNAVAAVDTKLASATKNLTDLQNASAQYAANVTQGIQSAGNIVTLTATADVQDAIDGLQATVTQAQQFNDQLAKLHTMGLNTEALDEIAQGGMTSGGLTAQTLLTASSAQIAQINSLQTQLDKAATATGNTAANNMYGAGLKAAQGLVDGLNSQKGRLEATMADLAEALVKNVEKKLKIHSPSQVFHDLGAMIPHGMANGIAANAHMVHDQLGSLLDTAIGSSASLAGQAGLVNGSTPVGTAVTDPARVAALIAAVRASLAASGHAGSQLPLLYVAGDLVVRSHQDIDNINRSLYVTGQNVQRAKG